MKHEILIGIILIIVVIIIGLINLLMHFEYKCDYKAKVTYTQYIKIAIQDYRSFIKILFALFFVPGYIVMFIYKIIISILYKGDK